MKILNSELMYVKIIYKFSIAKHEYNFLTIFYNRLVVKIYTPFSDQLGKYMFSIKNK